MTGCISSSSELHGEVIRVVDGDTLYVKLENGKLVKVRLVGIDAPELEPELMHPGEYPGVTNISCLVKYAYVARDFLKNATLGKEVILVFDSKQGREDKYGRLLVYLYINSTDINELLVEKGLARVFYEKKFDKMEEYLKAEKSARRNKIGLWSCN
ncbi:putative endonuclease [Pyrococcus sp. ST04]|nr:putative endonuclease [Pyrococcus sp. ST04]